LSYIFLKWWAALLLAFPVSAEASKCSASRVLSVRWQKTKNLPAAKKVRVQSEKFQGPSACQRGATVLVGWLLNLKGIKILPIYITVFNVH